MSLQSRYRPWLFQAGPSAQSAPVQSRLIDAFGWTSALNAGSIVRTSGSLKYVVGAAPGPKSRGGFETTVGADAGGICRDCAVIDARATAAPATVARRLRLVIGVVMISSPPYFSKTRLSMITTPSWFLSHWSQNAVSLIEVRDLKISFGSTRMVAQAGCVKPLSGTL